MKYVIVGNSFAGIFAVEAIRRVDAAGEITIISSETASLYSRAMLHEWLSEAVSEDIINLRPQDFYDRYNVTPVLGHAVTGVNTGVKQVISNGSAVSYDKLLIAVGGQPFVPPIEGLDKCANGIFTFTRLSEAGRLKETIAKSKGYVVVLGAGLIGLQAAEALAHLGKKVAVVELMDTVLPLAVDVPAAELIKSELEAQGIEIYTNDSVVSVSGQHKTVQKVTLKSGKVISASALVIATGVRPSIEFLKGSGINIDRGIVVNEFMETNVSGVFAAGDCAQALELITGKTMVIPIIPVASTQGLIAGFNMAGERRVYAGGIPMNALQFGELQIVSYGFVKDTEGAEVFELHDKVKKIYKKVIVKSNLVVGAIFVRAIDRTGVFRRLIQEKIDVSGFKDKLLRDDFNLAVLPKEARKKLLTVPQ